MATMAELETALRNADAAGDAADARALANFIIEARKDPSNLIPEAQIPGTYPVEPSPTLGERAVGAGEAGLAVASGLTTGAIGLVTGRLKQLGQELAAGNIGTDEAGARIAAEGDRLAQEFSFQPQTPTGQEYAGVAGVAGETLVPVAPLGAELGAVAAGARAAGPQIAAGAGRVAEAAGVKPAAPGAVVTPAPGYQARGPAPGAPEPAGGGVAPGRALAPAQARALEIQRDPYNADHAGVKVEGGQAVPDTAAREAMRQGWRPGFVQAVKQMSEADRRAAQKELNIHKIGRKNERFRATNRPGDVVGETFQQRVNDLFGLKREAGKEIETAGETLKGERVDYAPAFERFEQGLQDIGVTIRKDGGDLPRTDVKAGRIRLSMRGSDIEGDAASKRLLGKVFARLADTDKVDAYALHRAKRWLDTQIEFGKKSKNGLLNVTERLVKGLRRDINKTLQDYSAGYKAANAKYSRSLGALDDIQKAVGTTVDLEGPSAAKALGQEARKLLTNYRARVKMLDAVARGEETLKDFGKTYPTDIVNQMMFANEIDHMFGAVAPGTFKGQIQSAIQSGLEAAQKTARKRPLDVAFDLVGSAVEKMRGVNEENSIKAIERLLKEQRAESKSKALVPTTGKF